LKILLVIADLGLGGAQQVVINLANELVCQGHKVWLYDVYPELRKEGMIRKLSEKVNLISPDFNLSPKNTGEKILNSFLYRTGLNKNYIAQKRARQHKNVLMKLLQEHRPDAVNSHVWWADWFVYNELPQLHNKWWITLHGSYSNMIKNSKPAYGFTAKAATAMDAARGIIYLSDAELYNIESRVNFRQKNLTKIYNGIPANTPTRPVAREELGLSDTDFVVFCASRAIREKGWEELTEAVLRLNSQGKNIQLLLAGDGPYAIRMERKIQTTLLYSLSGLPRRCECAYSTGRYSGIGQLYGSITHHSY
jgi:glycosyltransferase involved in cell wall biosynthesis